MRLFPGARLLAKTAIAVAALVLGSCGGDSTGGAPELQMVAEAVALRSSARVSGGAAGVLWVAWTEGVAGGESMMAARVAPDGQVTRWMLSPTPTEAAREPVIAVTSRGPLFAWWELADGSGRIRVAAWNEAAWAVEKTIEPTAGARANARLLAFADGAAHLTWAESLPGGGARLMSARRSASGMWSAGHLIRTVAANMLLRPDAAEVAAESSGALMAVWSESVADAEPNAGSGVLFAARHDPAAGTWSAATTIDTGPIHDARVTSLGAGTWVAAWIAVEAGGRTSLRAKRYVNGAWEGGSTRIDGNPQENPGGFWALDSNGPAARAAWAGQAAADPTVWTLNASLLESAAGHWTPPSVIAAPTSSQPSALRLQMRANGGAALAWGLLQPPFGPWFALTVGSTSGWSPSSRVDDFVFPANAPDVSAIDDSSWAFVWYRQRGDDRQDIMLRRIQ